VRKKTSWNVSITATPVPVTARACSTTQKTGCRDLSGRAAGRRSKLEKECSDGNRQPRIRNSPGSEPHETEHEHGRNQNRQQVDADGILFDQHVPDQADIQVFVGTIRAEVKIRLAVVDQVKAGPGLVAIETQMQMRSADSRHDQEGAGQEK